MKTAIQSLAFGNIFCIRFVFFGGADAGPKNTLAEGLNSCNTEQLTAASEACFAEQLGACDRVIEAIKRKRLHITSVSTPDGHHRVEVVVDDDLATFIYLS